MHTASVIVQGLLIFAGLLFVVLIGLVVALLRLPARSPARRVILALALRVGASLGAGLLAVPIEPIPGLDLLYDLGAPAALVYFWYTFIRDTTRHGRPPRGPVIDHRPG